MNVTPLELKLPPKCLKWHHRHLLTPGMSMCLREALKTSMPQTKELEKTLAEALAREELLRKEVQSLLTRATLKDPQLCRFYTGLRSVQVFDTIEFCQT